MRKPHHDNTCRIATRLVNTDYCQTCYDKINSKKGEKPTKEPKVRINYPPLPEPGLIWNGGAWEVNPKLGGNGMEKIYTYIQDNAKRGPCTCGKCVDGVKNPEDKQPTGHTADLIFFKVARKNGATKKDYEELIKNEFPQWLDGKEHNYLEIGANIGDQGMALMAMGLGNILGLWNLLTPKTMLPKSLWENDDSLVKQMAGQGFIAIQT